MSLFTSPRMNRYTVRKRIARGVDEHIKSVSAADSVIDYGSKFNGQKYPGGLGGLINVVSKLNYRTLQKRSAALFYSNPYAKGIVRRLVTNIINTGLKCESEPFEKILSVPKDSLSDWAEDVEELFESWAEEPILCDVKQERTFGKLQRQAMMEAYINGDVLVVLRQSEATGLPVVQLIPGHRVTSPALTPNGARIVDGVELDADGRHIAYWVESEADMLGNLTNTRIEAFGTKTGRRNAFLFFGIEKREDGVRGEPLLAIVMQGLSEIDLYRDSAQRKATLNSRVVGFIKRGDAPASLSMSKASVRTKTEESSDKGTATPVVVNEILEGMWMERLAPGEEPTPYAISGADVSFGPFETSIVYGIAWALEVPPEILTLSFSHNYSASQAATSEFRIFLEKARSDVAEGLLQRIYTEWFVSSVLLSRIDAPGFLIARSEKRVDITSAWTRCDWTGAIKPSIDPVKQANGYILLVEQGWITNDRAAREINGSKFSRNIRRLAKEREMKLEAGLIFEAPPAEEFEQQQAQVLSIARIEETLERVEEYVADSRV